MRNIIVRTLFWLLFTVAMLLALLAGWQAAEGWPLAERVEVLVEDVVGISLTPRLLVWAGAGYAAKAAAVYWVVRAWRVRRRRKQSAVLQMLTPAASEPEGGE